MLVDECVSFMLIKNGKLLLEQRTNQAPDKAIVFNIPAGHIENNETHEQTLYRELLEELRVKPQSFTFLCSLYHPTSKLQLLHYYVVSEWQGVIEAMEAEQVKWFPIDKAPLSVDADKVALCEYLRIADTGIFNN